MSNQLNEWVFILGGSSGIGLASARKMASHGFNLIIVHRDRGAKKREAELHFKELKGLGVDICTFNGNILDADFLEKIFSSEHLKAIKGKVRLFLHSVSMGNLGSFTSKPDLRKLDKEAINLTMDAMALSWIEVTNHILENELFSKDASVLALSSVGSTLVKENYSAVGVAKAALEAIGRTMAVELFNKGINVNIINAGITVTPSLTSIPHSDKLIDEALRKNPGGRLTLPEDVANAIYLFTLKESKWINGAIIRVDGGEQIV